MFEGVNAITVDGWGHLLKAFLPTNWALVITDVIFLALGNNAKSGLMSDD